MLGYAGLHEVSPRAHLITEAAGHGRQPPPRRRLCAGTLVVAGAGDQAAGGRDGNRRPGAVSATTVPSGVVFAATDRPALDPRTYPHYFVSAIPGRWHVMV